MGFQYISTPAINRVKIWQFRAYTSGPEIRLDIPIVKGSLCVNPPSTPFNIFIFRCDWLAKIMNTFFVHVHRNLQCTSSIVFIIIRFNILCTRFVCFVGESSYLHASSTIRPRV